MNGMEAWSVIAPILSAKMDGIPHKNNTAGRVKLNALDEAYVVTFGALNQMDRRDRGVKMEFETDGQAARCTVCQKTVSTKMAEMFDYCPYCGTEKK